jgi:hypothetical protein
MNIYLTLALILFVVLLPEFIRIIRILYLKHHDIKYVGNEQYETIGNKKYKWYEWLR